MRSAERSMDSLRLRIQDNWIGPFQKISGSDQLEMEASPVPAERRTRYGEHGP